MLLKLSGDRHLSGWHVYYSAYLFVYSCLLFFAWNTPFHGENLQRYNSAGTKLQLNTELTFFNAML